MLSVRSRMWSLVLFWAKALIPYRAASSSCALMWSAASIPFQQPPVRMPSEMRLSRSLDSVVIISGTSCSTWWDCLTTIESLAWPPGRGVYENHTLLVLGPDASATAGSCSGVGLAAQPGLLQRVCWLVVLIDGQKLATFAVVSGIPALYASLWYPAGLRTEQRNPLGTPGILCSLLVWIVTLDNSPGTLVGFIFCCCWCWVPGSSQIGSASAVPAFGRWSQLNMVVWSPHSCGSPGGSGLCTFASL